MSATAAARFVIHEWPDGVAVFDRVSGDTHALDALGAELLRLPSALRGDDASALAALAGRLQLPGDDPALAAAVTQTLARLRELELL